MAPPWALFQFVRFEANIEITVILSPSRHKRPPLGPVSVTCLNEHKLKQKHAKTVMTEDPGISIDIDIYYVFYLPSGKRTHFFYGKSQFSMGKLTMNGHVRYL